MSTHFCRVVELMRFACCHTIRGRSCLRKAVLAPLTSNAQCFHGVPDLQRRSYSLDSLATGNGRPTFGSVCQQHGAERMSPSSALAHRNLSGVAVQVDSFNRFMYFCYCVVKHRNKNNNYYQEVIVITSSPRNNVVLFVTLTSWTLGKWRRMYAVLSLVKK